MSTKQSKNQNRKVRAISFAFGLAVLGFAFDNAAYAADKKGPRIDYFGSSTSVEAPKPAHSKTIAKPPVGSAGATSLESVAIKSPEVITFERMDDIRAKYLPTAAEKVIINRSINKQAERLQQWIEAARSISKEFSTCSKSLKTAKVPDDCDDLAEFRDMTSDWYADVALVFSDMVKPRPSAKTIEQLQAEANSFKQRQAGLKTTQTQLALMEEGLRTKYRVHKNIHTDALAKYILDNPK